MSAAVFAESLRTWRATRRLSQLDLAFRASTTQRHVSFLENGRSSPGREMILRLATALDLTLRDRNSLLADAGFAPEYPESDLTTGALPAMRQALNAALTGHLPSPAVVIEKEGIAVAGNRAMAVLTAGVTPALLLPPVNLFRLALHPDGMAGRIDNLAEWSAHVIRAIDRRAERARSDELSNLAEELRTYVSGEHKHSDLSGAIAPLNLRTTEGLVRLVTTRTTFSNATDVTLSELELEAFLPADETSATLLQQLDQKHEPEAAPWPMFF